MRTIHKYPLAASAEQTVEMPSGAEILSAAFQGVQLVIWARVDTDAPLRPRTFGVFGTGHTIPQRRMDYVATANLASFGFWFHVFEILA